MNRAWSLPARRRWIASHSIHIGAAILGACLILLIAFFLWPFEVDAQVTAQEWRREIKVERYQENLHEGWDVPPGGVVVSSTRRYHHSEEYACGTEYCDESVYKDWYTYRIWEWTEARSFVASGEHSPHWPDASDINDTDSVNPERLGRRIETYTTIFTTPDRSYSYQSDEATWHRLEVGSSHHLRVNRAGLILSTY